MKLINEINQCARQIGITEIKLANTGQAEVLTEIGIIFSSVNENNHVVELVIGSVNIVALILHMYSLFLCFDSYSACIHLTITAHSAVTSGRGIFFT